MDKTYLTFQCDHFGRVFAHVEIKDRVGIGQDIAKGACRLDDGIGPFIVKAPHTDRHVSLSQIALQGDKLDLRIVSGPDQGSVGDNEFGSSAGAGIEGVLCAKRCVIDHSHPILFLGDITQQIPFDMVYPADHHGRCDFRLGGQRQFHPCKQKHYKKPHPPFHGFFLCLRFVLVELPFRGHLLLKDKVFMFSLFFN